MDILEKQSIFLWQKIYGSNEVGVFFFWGGGTWTSNLIMLMTNALPFEVWTIKTRCFLPHVFNTGFGEKDIQGTCIYFYGVILKNDTCALAKAFYFWQMNGCSYRNSFCDKKCLTPGVFQPRTLAFMLNALPFEVDSDISLCHME